MNTKASKNFYLPSATVLKQVCLLAFLACCFQSCPTVFAEEQESDIAKQHFDEGMKYGLQGEYKKALVCMESALKLEPDNLLYQEKYATALFYIGQVQEALSIFESIYKRDQSSPSLCMRLALVYAKQFRFSEAKEVCDKALNLPSFSSAGLDSELEVLRVDILAIRAVCCSRGVDYYNAISNANILLQKEPDRVDMLQAKARALAYIGRSIEAQEIVHKLIRLNGKKTYNEHVILGVCLLKTKPATEESMLNACEHFGNAIAIYPQDPNNYIMRAICRIKLQDYKRAIEDCNVFLKITNGMNIRPKYAQLPYLYSAWSYWHLGDFESGNQRVTHLLKIDPDHPGAIYLLSLIQYSKKKYAATIELLDLMIASGLHEDYPYFWLSNLLLKCPDKALRNEERALELSQHLIDHGNPIRLRNYQEQHVRCLEANGMTEEAEALSKELAKSSLPSTPAFFVIRLSPQLTNHNKVPLLE